MDKKEKIFWKNETGSLLINLLVSLSILALLMTVSIPNLRKYQPNMKLSATARDITADLRLAQQLTVTEQSIHRVLLDFANDQYILQKTGVATSTIKSVKFPTEVSFNQITGLSNNIIAFNSYGGVSESGQIVLDNINDKISIIIVKPSGYIQLYQ